MSTEIYSYSIRDTNLTNWMAVMHRYDSWRAVANDFDDGDIGHMEQRQYVI